MIVVCVKKIDRAMKVCMEGFVRLVKVKKSVFEWLGVGQLQHSEIFGHLKGKAD